MIGEFLTAIFNIQRNGKYFSGWNFYLDILQIQENWAGRNFITNSRVYSLLITRAKVQTEINNNWRMAAFWTRGGGTPLYKPYRYVPPHRVGFLRRFGLKTGIHFGVYILVWNRVWFSRELRSVWTCLSFQFQMSKKEREICEFEMDLNNFLFAL